MNKLYKYLPFGIKGCVGDSVPQRLIGIRKNEAVIEPDNKLNYSDQIGVCNLDAFKPILRPFEDLTKELPLTKAAAEMIGMEEGEVVIPIIEFFKLALEPCVIGRIDLWQWEDISYDENRKCVKLISLNGSGICLYEDWYLEVSTEKNVIDEIPFDFLRAMHFAIDFKEDEYIKLED